ncbi:MAG: phosphatidylserine/phosphatidylglycerophosphate/cardiolipin synthase family protein [Gammaproteobacteria bacterium]|jgi:cardiolipin synthase
MEIFKSLYGAGLPAFIGFSLLLSACATPQSGREPADTSGQVSSLGSFGQLDYEHKNTRETAGIESGVGLFAKTVLVDPVIRPVSTVKALYGLVIKSTGGFVERTVIEQLRMPSLEGDPLPPIGYSAPMDLDLWENELDRITSTTRTSGNLHFLVDGEEYFTRLTEAIEQSETSIDIRTYIYDNDDVALELANTLRQKSETVEVRILVDGLADLFATRLDSSSMPDDVILPSSISDYLTYESKIDYRKQSNPWFTGDHAKITVIDGSHAFLGGMNIGREYRYDWHDLMMEVDGPVVARLQYEFDKSWAKAGMLGDLGWLVTAINGYPHDQSQTGIPLRILTTSIHDSELYRAQVAAIRRAQNRIYIENAYFSDDKILFELARARRRGVDVRVILSSENDSGILSLSNQKAINTMLHHGIRVYSYPGMTHVKAAIYDGWACLGSANFDKLSLQINKEINLGFSDPETVEQLVQRVFYRDFAVASELRQPLPLGTRHHLAELVADELF